METFDIKLTDAQFDALNQDFPKSMVSAATGKRAEELLKIHFRSLHDCVRFEPPEPGADLKIVLHDRSFEIEVKGTSKTSITWPQLKVSSQTSHDRLSQGLPMYRVVGVYNQTPKVYILTHDEDFELVPEPRWAVKRRPGI